MEEWIGILKKGDRILLLIMLPDTPALDWWWWWWRLRGGAIIVDVVLPSIFFVVLVAFIGSEQLIECIVVNPAKVITGKIGILSGTR